jgi:hypothetical protein
MSTAVAEITRALPRLSNEELRDLERAILQTYRQRRVGIIFDDAYGTFTEQDLVAVCEEALQAVEQAPPKP